MMNSIEHSHLAQHLTWVFLQSFCRMHLHDDRKKKQQTETTKTKNKKESRNSTEQTDKQKGRMLCCQVSDQYCKTFIKAMDYSVEEIRK